MLRLDVVNKTTLACTAVCNANTHSEWLIIINLDQSVQKKLLQYKSRQTTIKKFNKQFFLLRMRLVYILVKRKSLTHCDKQTIMLVNLDQSVLLQYKR